MPRKPRNVIPHVPYHVVQRGNRKQQIFFSENDYLYYLKLLKENTLKYGLKIWAFCLMPNHIHMIVIPENIKSFQAIAQTHRAYTHMVNSREGWRGHLWQERFHSSTMDQLHLFAAVRYVERNPVRAGIVQKAQDYRFSSANFHVQKLKTYSLLSPFFLEDQISDWSTYLSSEDDDDLKLMRTGGDSCATVPLS